ncbi:YesL family protein [Aquibacillus koreensis]|uniref:YesL family protein n=1 Tax=Aquibacillus koreensis TaxID=279446 RepID=A0A9X4AJY4_9BACI|nr:YesL family protein [Aquibacillus koreensis]MCT2537042.1 YesL family protein [Aquibacillus koreensis]MDC3422304.1 YesL family protein [Aquibacillus koreensis]
MTRSLFAATEWIAKFAYINLLWMLFTIVGLVIFGFYPSTIAMFTIMRKWIMGNSDLAVFKTFWNTFKKEFLKSNLLGLFITIVGIIIYINLQYMQLNRGTLMELTHIPLYLFIIVFALTLLYLFPVYVHYDVSLFQMFKNALLIMFINPLYNIAMIAGIAITLYALYYIPGTLFFFGGSLVGFLVMATCFQAFQKVDQKKQQLAGES